MGADDRLSVRPAAMPDSSEGISLALVVGPDAADQPRLAQSGSGSDTMAQLILTTLLATLGFALSSVLALQMLIQERDEVASALPWLAPSLKVLCQPLNCTLRPQKNIDAILIDNSAFAKLTPESFRLSLVLRNKSATPVAVPALELTLIDAQDEVLVRRVLLSEELFASADSIEPGADWSPSVEVLLPTAVALRISGYRLLAFYP